MTDVCSTSYTWEELGLVGKEVSFCEIIHYHGDTSSAVSINSRSFQTLERSVNFMYGVIDGLIIITSPVCLNK